MINKISNIIYVCPICDIYAYYNNSYGYYSVKLNYLLYNTQGNTPFDAKVFKPGEIFTIGRQFIPIIEH